jgi:hypothetical protein
MHACKAELATTTLQVLRASPTARPGDHTRRCAVAETARRSEYGSRFPRTQLQWPLPPALLASCTPAPCYVAHTRALAPAYVLVAENESGAAAR